MAHPRVLLDQLGANALKSFSQNFLTSPHWADRLTDAVLALEADEVWEIGPGLGALTERLVEKTRKPIRVFEIDRKLAAFLRERFAETGHFSLIEGDFMDADVASLSEGKKISVLSNLPYHLSSPILFRLLEIKERVAGEVLTFQREFAERCYAEAGSENYAALTVSLALHYQIERLGRIPPAAFYPAPDVESEALIFRPYPSSTLATIATEIARAAFQQRRKTIAASLKHHYPADQVNAALAATGTSPQIRPEKMSPEQFLKLAEHLPNKAIKT